MEETYWNFTVLMRNKQYDIADSDRFIVYFGTVCDTIDLFVHGKEDLFYVYSLFFNLI